MSKRMIYVLFSVILITGCYSYQDFNSYKVLPNTFEYPVKLQMSKGELSVILTRLYSVKRGNKFQASFGLNMKNLSKDTVVFKEKFIRVRSSTDTFYLEMLYGVYDEQGKFRAWKRADKSSLTISPLDTISNMSFQFVGSKSYSFDTYKQSFMRDTLILELCDDRNNKFTEYMIGNEFHQSKRLF